MYRHIPYGGLIMLKLLVILLLLIGGTHSAQPIRSPCPHALRINTNYQWRNSLHFICLQMRPNQKPQLDVIDYASQTLVASAQINEMNINQMASFVDDEGTLRVLVAVPERINGTSMYSFDSQGNYINETFTTNTQLVSTMSIWKLELNWEWHLATANHPYMYPMLQDAARNARKPLPELGPMLSIHSWKLSYFDSYQVIDLPPDARVNKLEPMHINDQEFLIVALESNRRDVYPRYSSNSPLKTDSMIFKLDFGDGTLNWVQYQYLGTQHAIDASSFFITHRGSLKQDYYIALIGQSEPESNSTGIGYQAQQIGGEVRPSQHGLIIYKYLGDRFMETHSYPVEGASKLDTISYGVGDSYVVIAVLSGWSKEISIFLFDGLNLNRQMLPAGPRVQPYARAQPMLKFPRAINSESLRLFRAPSAPQMGVDGGYEKRTLDNYYDTLGLALSTFSDSSSNYGDENDTESSSSTGNDESLNQIPLNELIVNSTNDESHVKRNYVGEDLLGWCKTQINSILGDNFASTTRRLPELPRVDQAKPIELYGDVLIEGDLHISNLLYANRIEDYSNPNHYVIPIVQESYAQTFNDIERAHSTIDLLKQRVDQILVNDGTIQEVYSPLKFDKLYIECVSPIPVGSRYAPPMAQPSCLQVGEIRTNLMNNRDIRDIREQALLTGRSMKISHDIRFEHLILRGKTSILHTLNGIRIEDIVFRQGTPAGPIRGHKNLRNPLYSSTNLAVDNWRGYRVDRQNYLTSSGDQRIDADLRFDRVIIDSGVRNFNVSSRIEILNGLHLDTHLSQIAQADDANLFNLPVSFDELIIQGPTNFPAGSLLANTDIEDLWLSTMFKHSQQNITAPIEFLSDVHLTYGGDIFVDGPLNGVLLSRDNVMMRNRNYMLPNPMIFDGDMSVRLLQVEKALNGIQVVDNLETRQRELAILYDKGLQHISSDKIFNEIRLGGSTQIDGLINGHLDLAQLYKLALNTGSPFKFDTVHLRGQNIRIGENVQMRVNSLINNIPANDICGLAKSLSQPTVIRKYDRLRFEQPVTFNSLHCASINGFNNLNRSFLLRHGTQRVAGTLKLLNGVVFNSTMNIGGTYNDLSVSSMSHAINQVINETISGHKDFYGDLYIDDLTAGMINDLPMSQVFIATADNPQLISAPMTFDHLDIENVLVIGQDLFTHSFNGLNVSDIISNTLQYDAPQVVYNHVELDHLQILPGANLITKSLNGRDLRRVYDDSVLFDAPQQILAPKTFNSPIIFVDRVFLRYGIDGLSEGELKFNLMLQGDELVENDLEFNNDVTIMKALEIQTGLINDIDVNLFVNSMLHENRTNGLRLLDNSSLRFKDVRLNNLVVTGTIQGLDLSRDALYKSDNRNGSYDAYIRNQQILINNQRISDHIIQTKPTFKVQTNHHNETFAGTCQIHSCPQTTPVIPTAPKFTLPPPMALITQVPEQQVGPVWRPIEIPAHNVIVNATPFTGMNSQFGNRDPLFEMVDPKYLEYQANLKAQAIRDLTGRVNKYLSLSYYYEIYHKHPLLGPVLHAAINPITSEEGSTWLLLKSASKKGEPCLHRGQKIDIMRQQRFKGGYTQFTMLSQILETSNPSLVESLVANNNNYLFVIDIHPTSPVGETESHILIYVWNKVSGWYDIKQKIPIDGFPTALKAFTVNQNACFVLANPIVANSNHTGAPGIYCQRAPSMDFILKTSLPMQNIFDLDIYALPSSSQILMAALSQERTEQVGDLIVSKFDVLTGKTHKIVMRRIARPLKLHFIKQLSNRIQLVVTEGITSNDAALATTRVFSLQPSGLFVENQIIRDNQFTDVQSVVLNYNHSLVFLKSTHSISIYAPIGGAACELSLVQRLPLKGANKFLVFNNRAGPAEMSRQRLPYEHILVLSKDDCEHQQYSTIILKPRFG